MCVCHREVSALWTAGLSCVLCIVTFVESKQRERKRKTLPGKSGCLNHMLNHFALFFFPTLTIILFIAGLL